MSILFSFELDRLIKDICKIYYPKDVERNVDIMIHRFGLNGNPVKTLEEIGVKYSLTRERIRQSEKSILNILTVLMRTGKYIKEFKLKSKFIYLNDVVFKEVNKILSFIDIDGYLIEESKELSIYDEGELSLILECFGFKKHNFNHSVFSLKKGWFRVDYIKVLERYFDLLQSIMKEKSRVLFFDFIVKAKKRMKDFDEDFFISLFDIINGLNIVCVNGVSYIELDFKSLSTVDKIYRLLESENILSVNEIFRLINKDSEKILTLNNIRNQMVADNRFEPIGKSGKW